MKFSLLSFCATTLFAALPAQDATVTVLHGVPGLPAPVEVFANGGLLFSFDYGEQQGPLTLPPGSYALDVQLNGASILSLNATLAADTDYSVIANLDAAGNPQLNAFVNQVDNVTLPTSRLYVRHTAEAPTVDIILEQNGAVVATIPNVSNGQEAQADVAPGTYDVRINAAGTSTTAFGPASVRVENGLGYGIFAVGQVGTSNFTLLQQRVPLTALVTVAHGIPALGAPVTVEANGNALFTFDYREVVGPLRVLPGTYTFDAVVNGNSVLNRTDTVARGDDVSIVAHLDGAGAPQLSAFVNDASPLPSGQSRVTVRHLAAAPTVDVVIDSLGVNVATIPALSNGQEATTPLGLGIYDVRLEVGGQTVFGPVSFRPVDNVQYQFLALGDFVAGSFTVELVQRDLTPSVPSELVTTVGGWSCGPTISAEPSTFDYGQPWALVATGAEPGAMAMINYGDSISSIGTLPLPLALDAIGAQGCFLNTSLVATIAVVADQNGRVEVPFLIPASLFGQLPSSFFQIGTTTSGNTLGFVTTEYLQVQ
ncbi:MAG: DUF4397 domain-containing protein [Planctomycetota bacterium]